MKTSNFRISGKDPNAVAISRGVPVWYKGKRMIELAPSRELMKVKDNIEYSARYQSDVLQGWTLGRWSLSWTPMLYCFVGSHRASLATGDWWLHGSRGNWTSTSLSWGRRRPRGHSPRWSSNGRETKIMKRWTMQELSQISNKELMLSLIQERQCGLNPYAPLAIRLNALAEWAKQGQAQ